ncbi:MAG TPA: KinB-signaling pathway activation protein [Bacillales bacterium]|nr:KinB-signaling pathway activation protein [Bacillales bacterium]
MKIRNWLFLFFSTLLIGGVIGAVLGVAFNWSLFTSGGAVNFIIGVLEVFGFGCMFSVISQMGFFAYLTVHRFGIGMFRSPSLWNGILAVLTAFVLFDLFYFRFIAFREPGESPLRFMLLPLFLFLYSWWVSVRKRKETNRTAFLPTLFFMVVVTVLEWYYPLKTNSDWMWIVGAVLLACNTWQVLVLHRLLGQPKQS